MPRSPRILTLILAVMLALATFGCSYDEHTFVSTVNQPTTLTLLDTTQNESVWEMDIPVDHMLVLDFENSSKSYTAGADGSPSWVDWQLFRTDGQPVDTGRKPGGTLVRSDRVDLTGTLIRMQVTYREAPEIPGSLDAAPMPVTDTPESVAAEAAAEAKAQSEASKKEEESTDEAAEQATEEPTEEAAEPMDEEADKAVK